MPATAPLIKGFLPVRLKLSKDDETFFYVKEHQAGKSNNDDDDGATTTATTSEGKSNKKAKPGCTLFVVNAPIIPGVSTKLALRSILGRFADVSRVTVVPNPRRIRRRPEDDSAQNNNLTIEQLELWSDKLTLPTFLPPIFHEGKYAHVVFASSKGLKKTLQELHRVMSSSGNGSSKKNKAKKPTKDSDEDDDDGENDDNDEDKEEENLPGLTMDRLELQTLADETWAQYERDERKRLGKDPLINELNDDDDDDDDFEEYDEDGNQQSKKKKHKKLYSKEAPAQGALAVVKRYYASSQALSRAELLAECNRVMGEYEKAEAAKRKAHQKAKDGNMVDDDGFVTVSYSSNTATGNAAEGGIHNLLEESITTTTTSHSRRNAPPRRRNNNNKKKKGSDELQDFYRFQRKEHKKRSLADLRTQFEEDLRKIKKMKQEHQYRPFKK
ncbi:unnamed protein product [Cylindrotheca closterium]|uniref:Ribosomal RNA-processing protein 7 C-terminal domain-containing protein n=1 Tax=Cylindrotheca closterium TaxID=2856 RepID=A0AAD2CEA9_9STRA|nr:unnamed protein product [Cylindrotheca closterium]CAJ1965729.1 unnamed protein product [Cylindrotheca closterium]